MGPGRHGNILGAWCSRGLLFAGLWWALSEGRPSSWGFGLAFAALAATVSLLLRREPLGRLSPAGVLRFVPFFLWRSFVAAVQVSRLALAPRLRLHPSLVAYPLRLKTPRGRLFFANTLSLLPGTLSVDLWGGQLRIHALDAGPDTFREAAGVEERVADLFGETLAGGQDGRI